MQCEEVATTDGGSRAEPRTCPVRRSDIHKHLGRVPADKVEVRREHGDDGVIEELVAGVRLHNEHGPHFGTVRVAERVVYHYHVATPVDHWSHLSCQSSASSSARRGYMPRTSCSSSNSACARA